MGLASGELNFYAYVHDSNLQIDPLGLMSWINDVEATIIAGNNTGTFSSSSLGHAEMNGLNSMQIKVNWQDRMLKYQMLLVKWED